MNASSFVSPPQLLALARELELPSCVCEQLVQTAVPALLDACAAQCMALTAPDTAFPAWKHLEAQFSGRDPDGMQILALYLAAACRTREKYRMMCIPDEIFRDTMGCFSRFCGRPKPVPAGSYLTVPFGAGGILPAGCSGSVHWSLNTVPVDSSEPLPPGIAAHCPALSVYILPVAHLSDHALRDSYEQAERFFALHASSCMRTVSPWLCCAAPGFSGPRWTHSCRRTPKFSDLETTMRYTRPAPKTNPSICDHSMEKLPLRCQNKPACSALLPPIWNMAAHRLRVRKQKTTVKAFQKLFCCIFITSPASAG